MHRSAIQFMVAFAAMATTGNAQSREVPIRQLSAPTAFNERFAGPSISIAELPDSRVLVKDNYGRRLLVLDSALLRATTIADTLGTGGSLFPLLGANSPLIHYRGDTTLYVDAAIPGFVTITPNGKVGPVFSHPKTTDLYGIGRTGDPDRAGFDDHGRFIYRASDGRPAAKPGEPPITAARDTIKIVRLDLDTRNIDTIGSYGITRLPGVVFTTDPSTGKRSGLLTFNPFPMGPDGWAVLSTGTVGIVRAHDYRVDWIASDGKQSRTEKLPYDWKAITDDDKRARIDSMKRVIDSAKAAGSPMGVYPQYRRGPDGRVIATDTTFATITFVTLDKMPDYIPPIRGGAVSSDRIGNLWILPTTSAHAKGGLLYDVVNESHGLHERVQLPKDCLVVGFGRKDNVFLACSVEKQWTLERRQVLR